MEWRTEVGIGGWARFRAGDGVSVVVRFRPADDGRMEARELYITGEKRLHSNGLRAIPLGHFEAIANSPAAREALSRATNEAAEGRTDLADAKQQDWLDSIFPPQTVEVPLISNLGTPLPRTTEGTKQRPRLRIAVPKGHKHPDDFYRRVAAAYSWLAGRTRRPAAELAAKNNVPVSTVHRWIKEARRRGLLGPGRRGRVG